jgi:hypothetical protein
MPAHLILKRAVHLPIPRINRAQNVPQLHERYSLPLESISKVLASIELTHVAEIRVVHPKAAPHLPHLGNSSISANPDYGSLVKWSSIILKKFFFVSQLQLIDMSLHIHLGLQ